MTQPVFGVFLANCYAGIELRGHHVTELRVHPSDLTLLDPLRDGLRIWQARIVRDASLRAGAFVLVSGAPGSSSKRTKKSFQWPSDR